MVERKEVMFAPVTNAVASIVAKNKELREKIDAVRFNWGIITRLIESVMNFMSCASQLLTYIQKLGRFVFVILSLVFLCK